MEIVSLLASIAKTWEFSFADDIIVGFPTVCGRSIRAFFSQSYAYKFHECEIVFGFGQNCCKITACYMCNKQSLEYCELTSIQQNVSYMYM